MQIKLELNVNKMLKNVTNIANYKKIKQLLGFTCFYIHVDSDRVGVAYA